MGKINSARMAVLAIAATVFLPLAAGIGSAANGAEGGAKLYVIQGLPYAVVDVDLDGETVSSGLAGATSDGPFEVKAGEHTVTFTDDGDTLLTRTMEVAAGDSIDIVLHLPADPAGDPVVTLFDNEMTPVPADKAALTVAHTAAVVPADIRVDGKVLFSNVANGESLNLVVPVGTYSVDIVPAGKDSPAVLGPLDLTVTGGSLNRVFAVGDPESEDMRVVVQVLDVENMGSDMPSTVETGSGGQAVGATPDGASWSSLTMR